MFEPGRFFRQKKVPIVFFRENGTSCAVVVAVTEFTYLQELRFKSLDETSQISFVLPAFEGKEYIIEEESKKFLFEAIKEVNLPLPLPGEEKGEKIPFSFLTEILCEKWGKDPEQIESKYSRQQIIEWCYGIGELNKWLHKDNNNEETGIPSVEEIETPFFKEMKEKYATKGGEKV